MLKMYNVTFEEFTATSLCIVVFNETLCTKCINIFAWAPILSEHEACQSFDLPDNQNGRRKHSTYPALPLINETTGVNTSGIYHLYIIYNIYMISYPQVVYTIH